MADALTLNGEEGRGVAAISLGEVRSNLWSGNVRMGKPSAANQHYVLLRSKFKIQISRFKI